MLESNRLKQAIIRVKIVTERKVFFLFHCWLSDVVNALRCFSFFLVCCSMMLLMRCGVFDDDDDDDDNDDDDNDDDVDALRCI